MESKANQRKEYGLGVSNLGLVQTLPVLIKKQAPSGVTFAMLRQALITNLITALTWGVVGRGA